MQDKTLAKHAAHLVAALLDPHEGVATETLSQEVRDALAALRDELAEAGYLAPYRLDNGSFGVSARNIEGSELRTA